MSFFPQGQSFSPVLHFLPKESRELVCSLLRLFPNPPLPCPPPPQPHTGLGGQGRTFGKSRLSKGVGVVYSLQLLASEVTGVKCKPGAYLSQSNMLCNKEQWALCERLFGQQPQVQDYSALHPELCGTKILEVTGDGKANGPMGGTRRRGNNSWQTRGTGQNI